MDRGAWQAKCTGLQSRMRLSDRAHSQQARGGVGVRHAPSLPPEPASCTETLGMWPPATPTPWLSHRCWVVSGSVAMNSQEEPGR